MVLQATRANRTSTVHEYTWSTHRNRPCRSTYSNQLHRCSCESTEWKHSRVRRSVQVDGYVDTRLGFQVPVGSVLASHIPLCEGNVSVLSDLSAVDEGIDVQAPYPDFPLRPVRVYDIDQPADLVARISMSA
ncbi:hypothetical protein ScPMuIL_015502 [Solemya velum]